MYSETGSARVNRFMPHRFKWQMTERVLAKYDRRAGVIVNGRKRKTTESKTEGKGSKCLKQLNLHPNLGRGEKIMTSKMQNRILQNYSSNIELW